MVSEKEASQQRLLGRAITVAIVAYVATVSALLGSWIGARQTEFQPPEMAHEVISRTIPEAGSK